MKIKVGDTVVVVAGDEKSRGTEATGSKDAVVKGEVLRVFPESNRVIVENVNMLTKHEKPQGPGMPGGIIKTEGSINVSNVMYYCPKCKKGVKVGYDVTGDKKVRVCRSCGVKLD